MTALVPGSALPAGPAQPGQPSAQGHRRTTSSAASSTPQTVPIGTVSAAPTRQSCAGALANIAPAGVALRYIGG